jgi:uncharacterized protein (DUF433 family)
MSSESPIKIDPQVLSGKPCFTGTRVPVDSLFDHLRLGYSVEEFIELYSTVTSQQVDAVLEMVKADPPRFAAAMKSA